MPRPSVNELGAGAPAWAEAGSILRAGCGNCAVQLLSYVGAHLRDPTQTITERGCAYDRFVLTILGGGSRFHRRRCRWSGSAASESRQSHVASRQSVDYRLPTCDYRLLWCST